VQCELDWQVAWGAGSVDSPGGSGRATSVTFWENEEDEEASRANILRLVEGMSHLLASEDVYQETFEVVHDQHPIEHSEEASPTRAVFIKSGPEVSMLDIFTRDHFIRNGL
jgi:hypothetical protein